MPRKKKKAETPQEARPSFHEGLEGFDIKMNSFGQMETTFEIDKLNAFLNQQEGKVKAKAEASAEKAAASKEVKAKAKEKGEGEG